MKLLESFVFTIVLFGSSVLLERTVFDLAVKRITFNIILIKFQEKCLFSWSLEHGVWAEPGVAAQVKGHSRFVPWVFESLIR